jgi:two-component system, cell cycle response regulator
MIDDEQIDGETGLPDGNRLLQALQAEPHTLRGLELLAVRSTDGVDEPFLVASDPDLGRRVGAEIRAVAAEHRGRAYRLGGTCYATLLPAETPPGLVAAALQARLAEVSEQFAAGVLHARVSIPIEAPASRAAIQLAFRRLRTRARWHPLSPGRQVRDVLLQLLTERCAPGDQVRSPEVVGHAVALGRRLGLDAEELDDLVRAAELQDVGMIALRSGVLDKRSPLDAADWAVIRHHPVVGERVIAAASGLANVARIVRSCYERFDGSGYPDGLKAEQIPLSARIITVCVAYAAMTSWRPYRPPLAPQAAMSELARCAGTQFDPRIVALFHEVVSVPEARVAADRAA